MNDIAPPPSSPTAPLWERLRATFARAIAAFGAPAAIALLSFTTRAARLELIRTLMRLENLVRKTLLIDAMAMPPPRKQCGPRLIEIPLNIRAVIAALNQGQHRPRSAREIDLARPETWSAQFALSLPHDPKRVPESRAPRIRDPWAYTPPPTPPAPPPIRNHRESAFLIARRFEALRRVLDDPAPYVRRLASAQRRASHRTPGIVMRYAITEPRSYIYDPHDPRLPVDVNVRAMAAAYLDTR